MADNMTDDRTGGTQEIAGEQVVLSTGAVSGTPPSPTGGTVEVDLETTIRMLSQTREIIEQQAVQTTKERAQQAAWQL